MARTDEPAVRQSAAVLSSPARERYRAVRQATEALTRALTPEDQLAQSMPDASPTKWHLAHTPWFFETFLLAPRVPSYKLFDPRFHYLFNSYYEALGPRQPRPERGLITRPSHADVIAYRRHVDEAIERANALEFGLSAYVFTNALTLANDIADRLEVGICGINTFAAGLPELPFGGVKQSGFGREGGAEGIWEFLNPKMVHAVLA